MTTANEMLVHVEEIDRLNCSLQVVLAGAGSKGDFIELLDEIEAQCRELRAKVVRHSRSLGKGLRADGKPDRRFRSNRSGGTDLRFSR